MTDLGLCDCFERKKLRLITEEIRYIIPVIGVLHVEDLKDVMSYLRLL